MTALLLVGVLSAPVLLTGCRPGGGAGSSDSSETPGDGQPDGDGGQDIGDDGQGPGDDGDEPEPGDQPELLRASVYDDRLQEPTSDYPGSGVEPYLETSVRPGDEVLVGQGRLTVTLHWARPVSLDDIEPFISLDPTPTREWNWLPEWGEGSCLQFVYNPDEGPTGVSVILTAGMPLGGDETLAEDFTFHITRDEEPSVTMQVVGTPWIKSPYDRPYSGYAVRAGRHEVRVEFSHTPDRASAEDGLGVGRRSYIDEARWESERVLLLTLDLAPSERAVLDVNGTELPGWMPVARQTPLVLEGREAVSLAVLTDPADPVRPPELTPLNPPFEPGSVSPDGEWALLWEKAPYAYAEEAPDVRPVPWLVSLETGRLVCVDGIADFSWMVPSRRAGWSADGRLIAPFSSQILALTPGLDPAASMVLDGPAPESRWKYLATSVSPDGLRLAWLEITPYPAGQWAETMDLTVLDLATLARTKYPAAAPVRLYDSVYYETPEIVWLPLGDIGLWRDPADGPGFGRKVLWTLDRASGEFVEAEGGFTAPDGRALAGPVFWTHHENEADWLAAGLAVGTEPTPSAGGQAVLVTPGGRFNLAEIEAGRWSLVKVELSPDGELLALEDGSGRGQIHVYRCGNGEEVRSLEGRLLGWTPDGRLWLVVPAEQPPE